MTKKRSTKEGMSSATGAGQSAVFAAIEEMMADARDAGVLPVGSQPIGSSEGSLAERADALRDLQRLGQEFDQD